MSKKHDMKPVDFADIVMGKVKSRQISMKPGWYFAIGSILMALGVACLSLGAVFLINLMIFLTRTHGPMGDARLQNILGSFPVWIPALALTGIILGIVMLKKYDFSYKKNFLFISFVFIVSIILAAALLDVTGMNNIWSKQGPMRRFYQQIENQNTSFPKGSGQGWGRSR